jgi:hypothetical protein
MTLARSYNPKNSHVFENGLRISLTKLEKYRRGTTGQLHDIVCTTNLSNSICATLDSIIMQEDSAYVPKKPVPAPISNIVADATYVKRPKKLQNLRKRSSLGELNKVYFFDSGN